MQRPTKFYTWTFIIVIYVNNLPNTSNILDLIMFADDTNLSYSHHNIKTLFSTVIKELEKLQGWFRANRENTEKHN